MKEKNLYIELWRFLAAITILFYHTNHLGYRIACGGWIFVEFFFIVSGYYTTAHFSSGGELPAVPEKEALLYTLKKLVRVLPYAICGILLSVVANVLNGNILYSDISTLIIELPLHFSMLKMCGFTYFDLCRQLWYLTGLLLVLPILILLINKKRDFLKYIGCWLIPILCYMFLFIWHGDVSYWDDGSSLHCLIRALAGVTLGSLVYHFSTWVRPIIEKWKDKDYLKAFEVLLMVAVIVVAFAVDVSSSPVAFIYIMVISLCITFSGFGVKINRNRRFFEYLGKLSLPVFCLHLPVLDIIEFAAPDISLAIKACIGVAATLILSVILLKIVSGYSERKKAQ